MFIYLWFWKRGVIQRSFWVCLGSFVWCFSTSSMEEKKNHYYTKHIRLQAQIHYEEMLIPWRFIQRIYWQTSCVACFIQRFYYIIMYRCHLLHCWWPVMGQVFTDHTCLYKQIMSQWSRLQILWDNMSNWKIKHYSPFKVLDITVSGS